MATRTEIIERCEALYEDLTGQVTQAVSKPEWFNKWGKHYLPSLKRAHELQITNN